VQEVKAPIKNSTAMSISGEVTRPLPSELHCYDILAKSPSHTETSATLTFPPFELQNPKHAVA